jgi:hypothetical protein
MLEDLSAQLARVTLLDQAKVAASFGTLQGMEMRESAISTTLGLARAYAKTGSDGKTSEVVPEAKVSTSSELGTFNSIGTANNTFAQAPQDIFSDQVNLQYQVFNLRMIMDRSLTDRIQDQGSKLQAVLGIPVSLDPSREALDSAAIVKITVTLVGSQKPVSVVALMPQEKTYNSATLSKSSKAFGASAVAKVVQIGFNAISRGQTYFVYRDNDTVSFEHPATAAAETVFGWQFRPVLGRRSVAPGMRQMFAVVALPVEDKGPDDYKLNVKVETFWVKYQRSQLTTYPKTLWYETLGALVGKP